MTSPREPLANTRRARSGNRSAEPANRGPKDPDVAAVAAFVNALYADGLPTARTYVTERLREAGLDIPAHIVTSACGWVPYRPAPRRGTR